ncbi:MAG: PqiA/YebS family transporter subunit [Vibrio sp.]
MNKTVDENKLECEHHHQPHLHACEECGLVVELPQLKDGFKDGFKVQCPRCDHTLISQPKMIYHTVQAYGISLLIMLALSCSFPFMSFSVKGLSQQVTLLDAAISMHHYKNTLLTLILILCVLILPMLYTIAQMYIHAQLARLKKGHSVSKSHLITLSRWVFRFKPWMMADVFLVGILVAMVKIVSLADVWLGPSFWAFCGYSMLVVKVTSLVNAPWIWEQLVETKPVAGVKAGDSHLDKNHIACHHCHHLNPYEQHGQHCVRCHSKLHKFDHKSNVQKAWALLIAAAILYIPANLYPMMLTTSVGQTEVSTVMGGVILLWHLKSYPVAMVIFFASIMIPITKIFMLMYLYRNTEHADTTEPERARKNITIYRITEFIGRWSMIDIFVVALLTALVQLNKLMTIEPGQAALSFAAVVVLTMLSALTFDSRSLWQRPFTDTNSTNKQNSIIDPNSTLEKVRNQYDS